MALRSTWKSIAAVVLVSGLVLSGCSKESTGSSSGGSSNEGGRGPITYAMGKVDSEKLQHVIEKWNSVHPDEKVTFKELAGEADDQRDSLVQTLQAGRDDIDVMALDVVWTAEFAANQWLAPLEGDLAVDTSGLLQSTVASGTYNNKLYALPQNTNGQLLYRNTEVMPESPQTFQELVDSCSKAKDAKQECLTLQLKQYEGLTVNTIGFMEGWGGKVLDDSGKPVVDSENSKAGLKALVDAYTAGNISKDSASTTEEETAQAFTEGKTAYAINWPYMFDLAGKDPSKVDRSASYATRWVAKNVVAAGLADRCEVQVAYAIGRAHPVGFYLDTFGTAKVPEQQITDAVNSTFDLRPASIIADLDLLRPIYRQFSTLGHFGRTEPDATWETTGRAQELARAVKG